MALWEMMQGGRAGTLGDSGLADATRAPWPWCIKGAGKVGTWSAPLKPLAHPNPPLSLSSALPLPPHSGLMLPRLLPLPMCLPPSPMSVPPPRSERCPWASLLLPCSACGAVPSPLLSSASARNAMLVVPPGGVGVGAGGGKRMGGSSHGWGEEGYQPSALESLPCPANCHTLSRAWH